MTRIFLLKLTIAATCLFSTNVHAQDYIKLKSNKIYSCTLVNVTDTSLIVISKDGNQSIKLDSIQSIYVKKESIQEALWQKKPSLKEKYNPELPSEWEEFVYNENRKTAFDPESPDTIRMKGEYFYYKNLQKVPLKQISDVLNSHPEARKYVKKANDNLVGSYIFSFAGGFAMGYPVGGAIAGKEFNTPMFLSGVGLAALSIPFYIGYNKNLKKAVRAYNKSIKGK